MAEEKITEIKVDVMGPDFSGAKSFVFCNEDNGLDMSEIDNLEDLLDSYDKGHSPSGSFFEQVKSSLQWAVETGKSQNLVLPYDQKDLDIWIAPEFE